VWRGNENASLKIYETMEKANLKLLVPADFCFEQPFKWKPPIQSFESIQIVGVSRWSLQSKLSQN